MICSALVYILLTSLSDLTAPLPWTQHTSVKGFVVLQKQVLLHTNRQHVETLRTISLLLKAFSGGPSLPIVALQHCCKPPPVCHGWLQVFTTHFCWIHALLGCAPHPITIYSVLSIKDVHNVHKSLKRGFLPFFLPFFLPYFVVPLLPSPNSQGLRLPCRLSAHLPSWEKRGDIEHSYLTSSH